MILNYFEEDAKLIVLTTSEKQDVKYTYQDVPISVYWQIHRLHQKKADGKIWKLLKGYTFLKTTNIKKEEK